MKLTATQQLILNALQGIFVHDFKKGFTHVGPKRVAWAAQVSYDRARRALAQLHTLGLVKKADRDEEWGVGDGLFYRPDWSSEGPLYATEFDERMSHTPDYYLPGLEHLLYITHLTASDAVTRKGWGRGRR